MQNVSPSPYQTTPDPQAIPAAANAHANGTPRYCLDATSSRAIGSGAASLLVSQLTPRPGGLHLHDDADAAGWRALHLHLSLEA